MPLSDAQIIEQNPWWGGPGWESRDPQLTRLERQPARLPAAVVDRIDLTRAAIHTLRGPRQVGKSTDLKLLAARALSNAGFGPRQVLYLSLELMQGHALPGVAATLKRARSLARGEGGALVLLDEVTFVDGWQTAIKSLWDDGTLQDDIVICTGSSAVDLRDGMADRLPGRRGGGSDHMVLPHTFAAFAQALEPGIPAPPGLGVAGITAESGVELLEEMRIHLPALDRALDSYMRFGGLPAAVAEATSGALEPSEEVKKIAYDSLLREIQREPISRPATHALLERVLHSLGSKTNWSRLSREMSVGLRSKESGPAVRDYVELLAAAYFLLVVYFWRSDSASADLSRDKKVYFGDPLIHTVAQDLAPGLATDRAAIVENLIGLALYRRYEDPASMLEGFDSPGDLHVWQTRRSGEIDFVCGAHGSLDVVEVKYQAGPDMRSVAAIPRAFPGRPVAVATKDRLEQRDSYTLIPASLLLWALG